MVTAAVIVGVTTTATLYSNNQNRAAANKVNRAQKKARSIDQRVASINNQREKRKAIAQNKILQAQALNSAGTTGVFGSSAIQGGIASGAASVAGAIGFQNTQLAGSQAVGAVQQSAADSAANNLNNAALAGVVSGAANSYYNKFGQPQ